MSETSVRLLSVSEVAEILKVSNEFVRRLIRQGSIPGRKIGREWRVEESELLKYVRDYRKSST